MGGGEFSQQRNIKAHIHGKTDCNVISGGEKASGLDLCQDCEVSTSLNRVPASLASTTHFQEQVGWGPRLAQAYTANSPTHSNGSIHPTAVRHKCAERCEEIQKERHSDKRQHIQPRE